LKVGQEPESSECKVSSHVECSSVRLYSLQAEFASALFRFAQVASE